VITVLLPVYNQAETLGNAIISIQKQTWPHWTMLIINDGSTDESLEIAYSFRKRDPRIKVASKSNQGIIGALNFGISQVETPYIARMDADDTCHPQRFAKQIDLLEKSSWVGLCGTYFNRYKSSAKTRFYRPNSHNSIENYFLFGNPIAHGSVVVRTELIKQAGGYSRSREALHVEDYQLWTKLIQTTRIKSIPEYLYNYTVSPNSISQKHLLVQRTHRDVVAKAYSTNYFSRKSLKRLYQPLVIYTEALNCRTRYEYKMYYDILRKSAEVARQHGCYKDFKMRLFLAQSLVSCGRERRAQNRSQAKSPY